MKRLDELGVSPAPWTAEGDCVYHAKGGYVLVDAAPIADARLVAAAPCLYEALREAIIEYCHMCDGWHRDGDRCSQADGSCFVQRWRKALEKAGSAS